MDEQRQFPRFLVHFPMYLLIVDGVVIGNGTGYDLSAGGCAVASQVNVGKGEYVALQLYLPDHQTPTIVLRVDVAVIRWIIQQKLGLEFIRMASGDQQRLRRYVTTLQTTNS